jgi:histone deacetylase 6
MVESRHAPVTLVTLLMDNYMDVDDSAQPTVISEDTGHERPRASSEPLVAPNYTVGYVYASEMLGHFSPLGHPEKPLRISRIHDILKVNSLLKKMKRIPIRNARRNEVLLAHSEDHWDKVMAIQSE